ncbi:MAG: methyltransferase domain-containing protein [bacterium]|nr:methyltransferase domain-containing protein [bacterium]
MKFKKSIFLKNFIKSPKYTGSIKSSSSFLAKKMVKRADLGNAKTIIELGPGTGVITKVIIDQMGKDSALWTFDINKEFVDYLNGKYPKANHIHSDILKMKEEMTKNNVKNADAVISGIPFSFYSKKECEEMLDSISDVMHKNSILVLFSYSKLRFKTFLSKFNKVNVDFVLLNIPPAYVLTLSKK